MLQPARKSACIKRETKQREVAASELELCPGEPGSASLAGIGIQMNRATEELTGESGMLVQADRSALDRSCVVEAWRSVQSEVHQDKGHLAS